MSTKSTVHYYDDGDLLIVVQDTTFRIHRNIIVLSSKVFRDMFSSSIFENLLSFLYPHKFIAITWANVSDFLQLADKYEIDSVIEASKLFLETYFREQPSLAFVLADRFRFPYVYKESSKLVLDILPTFHQSQYFHQLTPQTGLLLLNRYFEYITSIGNLKNFDAHLTFEHTCESAQYGPDTRLTHVKHFRQDFSNRITKAQVHPILAPSKCFKLFFEMNQQNPNLSLCENSFFENHLAKQFSIHFGKFEPLESKKNRNGATNYIFIEMKV
ncbi:3838_t:CDS:2 [Dentiscutata heterogama]|uniref:3838_t:CDS:1 n=1 Tax=Dentiscutata heterogama TaxID=1316150 RepID=A0ACA9M6E2_9GLOM|nr:3838_t:CDS:2 [Dentiscutata heterogama]